MPTLSVLKWLFGGRLIIGSMLCGELIGFALMCAQHLSSRWFSQNSSVMMSGELFSSSFYKLIVNKIHVDLLQPISQHFEIIHINWGALEGTAINIDVQKVGQCVPVHAPPFPSMDMSYNGKASFDTSL